MLVERMNSDLKTCLHCGTEATRGEFHRDKTRPDGLFPYCKKCANAQARAYREAHPDRVRASQQRCMDAKPEQYRAMWHTYNATHREENRAKSRAQYHKNPEAWKASVRAWRHANPDLHRAHEGTRRARKANAPGAGFTGSEWIEMKERFGERCAYCDKVAPLTQEHLTPLSRGGAHEERNIVPACASCNSRKSTKTLWEFLQYQLVS